MIRALRQWWQLPAGDRLTLLALMALQPALSLSLRLRGYKRTLEWVNARSLHRQPRDATPSELVEAERLAQLANIAGRRGPLETTCLRQALAVHGLLRRRGLRPDLKLGVGRLTGQAADMHAWVELDGVPLAQPQLRHSAFQPAASASTASTTSGKTS